MTKYFKTEIGVQVFLIVVAAAFLWDTRSLPGPVFDPLGPAPVPRLICWSVIILCLVIIGQVVFARTNATPADETLSELDMVAEPEPTKPQPLLAIATLALSVAYVLVMAFRLTGFAVATIVYLILTIGMLSRFNKRSMIVGIIIALIMGFGCEYLFTEVFVIDLPTVGE